MLPDIGEESGSIIPLTLPSMQIYDGKFKTTIF